MQRGDDVYFTLSRLLAGKDDAVVGSTLRNTLMSRASKALPEQVKAAAEAFAVYYAKGEPNEAGAYLMDHSRSAYLMDREGKPLALLPVDESGDGVAAEIEKWAG